MAPKLSDMRASGALSHTEEKEAKVLSSPSFEESDWPVADKRNQFSDVVDKINGTDRTMSTTASSDAEAKLWTNQLHRAGAAIGKTVRTRTATTPDGRVVIRFKVVQKQSRRSE